MPRSTTVSLLFLALAALPMAASPQLQPSSAEQVQVAPPAPRVEPPPPDATPAQLEERGDQLRAQKSYLDALDYYRAALDKVHKSAVLQNKIGITELQMMRLKNAKKSFERAIKADRTYADAVNNLGVAFYMQKNYGKAIKQYQKALRLRDEMASFHSNLGTAYFSRKEIEKAMVEYGRALQLDPDIFERTSRTGVAATMSSPEDRAYYDYVVAKMYAKLGIADRSLLYLRKALEEGYKDINKVYTDTEFAGLRKDPRFVELMASRPPAIPE